MKADFHKCSRIEKTDFCSHFYWLKSQLYKYFVIYDSILVNKVSKKIALEAAPGSIWPMALSPR